MTIGVPSGASRNSCCISSFCSRMHPCDDASPIDHGSSVPWMPIGPCSTQTSCRASECAETPSAFGPNGPPASGRV